MKQISKALDITTLTLTAVFFSYAIYLYYNFKTHPEIYAMQSAPWYTQLLLWGMIFAAFLIGVVIAKVVIKKND